MAPSETSFNPNDFLQDRPLYKIRRFILDELEKVEESINNICQEGYRLYHLDVIPSPGGPNYIGVFERIDHPEDSNVIEEDPKAFKSFFSK